MFDRNQWLEWAKNSQNNNPEMKDSQLNVRKNDQTKGYLYEIASDGEGRNTSTNQDNTEKSAAQKDRERRIERQSKKIPSRIGQKVYSAGARALTKPAVVDQAMNVGVWKIADVITDKLSNRRKNDPNAPTRIIPNPVEESNDLDEAAFLLPLLISAARAAGGLAVKGVAKGAAKIATSGAKRLATTGKRLTTKVKGMGGKDFAMQGAMVGGPNEGQENLAVSSWRKSIQQLDEQQLDEFLGRLLKGAGRVFKRKPKMPARPRAIDTSFRHSPKNPSFLQPKAVGGPTKLQQMMSPAKTPKLQSIGSNVRDYTKFKKGYGSPALQKLGSGALKKFKGSKTGAGIIKDPLGAAGNVGKEYLKYKMMGLAMGGGQPKDPMATQAQSTDAEQQVQSDRVASERIARKPSRPIPT